MRKKTDATFMGFRVEVDDLAVDYCGRGLDCFQLGLWLDFSHEVYYLI
jgi:hypothetical protein